MTVNLIGWRKLNFTNNNGEIVAGTSVWLTWLLEETANSAGSEAEKFFIAEGGPVQLPVLQVGTPYTATFNNRGRLVSLTEASTAGKFQTNSK